MTNTDKDTRPTATEEETNPAADTPPRNVSGNGPNDMQDEETLDEKDPLDANHPDEEEVREYAARS